MSIKDQTIPVWTQMLGVLDGLLAKAEADPRGDALLEETLAEDMHPLSVQVRFLVNMPGEAMARLTGLDFTSRDDNPATLAEARGWIAEAKSQLEEWASRDFIAANAAVELAIPNGMNFDLSASEYVRDWALPQYYFHTTAAYSILRKAGIALGKADFVPYMMRYLRQS
ncbi:DUF1993 domain-containing protein [uncultured Erythrobacter sp.]|uniref:DUF1993 domain-containing protein n=1 Tax=uncultured Erythrobacter sp. TaxID=263913 RepID=UPI00260D8C77|nr:DUF1993 domain-containing protein [uncultured Erythrobacter sp.]